MNEAPAGPIVGFYLPGCKATWWYGWFARGQTEFLERQWVRLPPLIPVGDPEMTSDSPGTRPVVRIGATQRVIDWIERVGNKLPDPAVIFLIFMLASGMISWLMVAHEFTITTAARNEPRAAANQLTGSALTTFLGDMV